MKLAVALLVSLSAAAGAADLPGAWRAVLAQLGKNGGPSPQNRQKDPTEPSGFPNPSRTEQEFDDTGNRFVLRTAEQFSRTGSEVRASGNVHFQFRKYDVYADEAAGNLDTQVFTLKGNVLAFGSDQVLRGKAVTIDFRNDTFSYIDGEAQLGPGFLGGNLIGDLFMRGAAGGGNRQRLLATGSEITSCNLPAPHYSFHGNSADVIPGRRAILRNVRVQLFGRTLLSVPYVVVPLQEGSERYLPEFGQSPDEGYYVKTRLGIPLRGSDLLDTRIDYFTKLGGALGFDYNYSRPDLNGILQVYSLMGPARTALASFRHSQNLLSGRLSVDAGWQRNNYLSAPSSTVSNIRSEYSLPWAGGTSRLSYFQNGSSSSGFSTAQKTTSLNDERSLGNWLRSSLSLNYNANQTKGSDQTVLERKQLDVLFRGTSELRFGTASLIYQRSNPVGRNENFISFSDQTPMLQLQTDSSKLLGDRFGRRVSFRTGLSIGELFDPRRQDRITRTSFDLLTQHVDPESRRSTLAWDGRFRQSLYSNDTAQYVLDLNSAYRYRLGPDTALALRYSYLRPYGFTPLTIDETGRTHMLAGEFSARPIRSLHLAAQTAFDFTQLERSSTAWQTLIARGEWAPNDRFFFRGLANYDPFQAAWSNVRLDLNWKTSGGEIGAGARFDGTRHTWGALNLFVDGLSFGRLKTSVLLAYNGYSRQFEARHFSFTYDMHCAEAVLQIIDNPVGFRSGREILLFVRLKILPSNTPFGTGRRGQAVGSGSGGFGF